MVRVGDRVERVNGGRGRGTVAAIEQKPDILRGFDIRVEWDQPIGAPGVYFNVTGLRPVSAVDWLAELATTPGRTTT